MTRYRMIFTLLGLALAALVVAVTVLAPTGRELELPPAIDSVFPSDGSTVLRQVELRIDMAFGYEIALLVDGTSIPADEIRFTEPTGLRVWSPGPLAAFAEWEPGIHHIEVKWERISGQPDVGELAWSFRTQ